MLAAIIRPDNTPGGYQLTYIFPLLVFIITATTLYLRFRSPHEVPGHTALSESRWMASASTGAGEAEQAEQDVEDVEDGE